MTHTIATVTSANANVHPANPGKVCHIESDAEPYFAWTALASLMATITPPKITDISRTVDFGKRNSGRMSHLVNEIDGERPLKIRRYSCIAPASKPSVSRMRNAIRPRKHSDRISACAFRKTAVISSAYSRRCDGGYR